MADEKRFKLLWTSQNKVRTFEYGEYASIPEATDTIPAAEAHLRAQHPASVDEHYPHNIKAGTWRVIPIEPTRAARAKHT